ncbi:MAG: hypothetical protein ACR2P2_13600 [Nakamurella sp.]
MATRVASAVRFKFIGCGSPVAWDGDADGFEGAAEPEEVAEPEEDPPEADGELAAEVDIPDGAAELLPDGAAVLPAGPAAFGLVVLAPQALSTSRQAAPPASNRTRGPRRGDDETVTMNSRKIGSA